MPRLNPDGRIAAGIGGTAVSVDRQVIAQPAGGAEWLDAHRVIYHRKVGEPDRWAVECFDTRNGEVTALDPQAGADRIVAGGGRWCAFLATREPRGVRGVMRLPNGYPYAMGADAAVAVKEDYHAAGGLAVFGLDGFGRILSSAKVENVQVLDINRVTWTEHGVPQALGLPVPKTLQPAQWLRVLPLRDGRMLALYQDGDDRLVLQWAHTRVGLPLTGVKARTFRPDLVELPNGTIRVCWAENEWESPDSIRDRDVALSELV